MNPESIIDRDFKHQIQKHLSDKEEIEWEGNPIPKVSITLLEIDGYFDIMTGPTSIFGFILAGMIIGGYLFYNNQNWMGLALTIILGLLVLIVRDIIKHERRKHTKYAFTKNRVFFQLWRWGKKSLYFMDFADIARISYQAYEDKSGILHFMPKKPCGFYTHDFFSGEKRFYPTFEMVPNAIELQKKLEALRRNRNTNINNFEVNGNVE